MDKSSKRSTSTLPPILLSPFPLGTKPLLDNEPRTLDEEELDLAREAALEVLRTHTEEEAKKIFLEGLVPIGSVKEEEEEVAEEPFPDEDDEDCVIVELEDLSISEDA